MEFERADIDIVFLDSVPQTAFLDTQKQGRFLLDAACLGNPLQDLGSFIAHLARLEGSQFISASELETQKNTLVTAYEQLTGTVRTDQLNRYIALSLFSLIHHPFRDWSPDWPAQTEALLERVENLLEY